MWRSTLLRFVLLCSALLIALLYAPRGLDAQDRTSAPDSAIALEPIVVTATPVPVPEGALGSHVSLLYGAELRTQGVTQVTDALRSVSGLTLVQTGSFGSRSSVFLRGGESDHVLVLLDGVPLNNPGGEIDLSGLTTDIVERIEIVRGPVSGLYGSDAVAGVIQIITRTGEDGLSGSGTLRGGSFGSLSGVLELRGGSDSGSFAASMARYESDGILAFNNGHRNTVLTGSADLRIDDASSARVTARLLDRTYRFPTDSGGNVVDVNQASFWEEATVGVQVDRRLSDAFDVRAHLTLHDVDSGTDDPPDGPDDRSAFFSIDAMRRVTGDFRANVRLPGESVVTAGVELEHQRIRAFSEGQSEFGLFSGQSKDSRSNTAGYLHALTTLSPVSLNGGIRVEDNEQFGNFVSFQMGSAVGITPVTRLRFAAGRAIKEPSFFEVFATGFVRGNPDLDPERSTSWEAGLQRDFFGRARVGVTWFAQSFEDLIQFTGSPPEATGPNYFNVAAADSRGLEVEADVDLGSMVLSTGWSWLDTEVVDSGFDQGAGATFVNGEPLIRRPRHQGTVALRGAFGGRVSWNTDLRWVSRRSDRRFPPFPDPPESVTLRSYIIGNAGLEVAAIEPVPGRPGLYLVFRAENLAAESYQEAFGFEAPGRGVYVGGRVRWGEP